MRTRSDPPSLNPAEWSDREMAVMAAMPDTGPAPRLRESRLRILERIRKAAIVEFSLHGLRGASTQAIAQRAGLTKPQLHYYILGKERLYEDLLGSVVSRWSDDESFDHASDDPAEALSRYIADKVSHALDNPELTRIFGMEILSGASHLEPYWPTALQVTAQLTATLERWMTQGLMRPLNAHLLLMNIWAMTSHYSYYSAQLRVMSRNFPAVPMDREAIVREITTLVLAGCAIAPR